MSKLARPLTWISALTLALPLMPCALGGGNCHTSPGTGLQAEVAPVRSCCADAGAAKRTAKHDCCHRGSRHSEPSSSCPRVCCRANPLAPSADKVTVERSNQAPAFAVLFLEPSGLATVANCHPPLLPAESLQSLHCLWRC